VTIDEAEGAFVDFVAACLPGATVLRGGANQVLTGAAVLVSVVSDVDVDPPNRYQTTTGGAGYSQQRRCTVQVDCIGGENARSWAQRVASLYRADSAQARDLLAAGVGFGGSGGVRLRPTDRGGSGTLRTASVDLTGYYLLVIEDGELPGLLDTGTLNLQSSGRADVDVAFGLLPLYLDDDGLLLLSDGSALGLEVA
jgi:hypothetical protein